MGDVTMDAYVWADVRGDIRKMPFKNDSFAACFADYPWKGNWRKNLALAIREMLRVAPIAYIMGPYLYGGSICRPTDIQIQWQPGVNPGLLFVRYERALPIDQWPKLKSASAEGGEPRAARVQEPS